MRDEGATHLADILRRNTSITELDLCSCSIDVAGLKVLADSLETNTKMLSFGHFEPGLKGPLNVEGLRSELREMDLSAEADVKMLIKQRLARNKRIVVENRLTAFAMGTHVRLGADAECKIDKLTQDDLLQHIAELVWHDSGL